ncbi:hypothetical protein PSTG_02615 [Puccinia striiformis f. sp. tritici PST-78]|uniref:Uncharacterized protein n=1 Tax=Puccinia striiformis f. sp. tritici PST-78 TaxID=1165861 RepID=A0A0L0VYC6_9BASI|nr:hypothetical protein PSTG_02615 [Puccinia striiformis f. sp. tritici PST-78]
MDPSHPNLTKSLRTREAKRVNILIKEQARSLAVVDSKSDERESGDETNTVNFGNLLDNLWTLATAMEVIQPTVRLTIPTAHNLFDQSFSSHVDQSFSSHVDQLFSSHVNCLFSSHVDQSFSSHVDQ